MSESLYERDPFAWSLEQAAALRAPGSNSIDYENVAEEIESLGVSEKSACESALELIMEHLLKIEHVGPVEHVRGWKREVLAFRKNFHRKLSPSLRAELSTPEWLDALYRSARSDLMTELWVEERGAELPEARPYDWGQLTSREPHWFPEPRYAAG